VEPSTADTIPLVEAYMIALKIEPRNAAEQEFRLECSVGLAKIVELEELLEQSPDRFPEMEL